MNTQTLIMVVILVNAFLVTMTVYAVFTRSEIQQQQNELEMMQNESLHNQQVLINNTEWLMMRG